MQGRRVPGAPEGSHVVQASEEEELPIGVDLADFHPTLVCPVSKQLTGVADPPVLLSCGHIISKSSATKISRSRVFKCPTCPAEQSMETSLLEVKFA